MSNSPATAQNNIDAAVAVLPKETFGAPGHAAAIQTILDNAPLLIDLSYRTGAAFIAGVYSAPFQPQTVVSAQYLGFQMQATNLWANALRAMAADPALHKDVPVFVMVARIFSPPGSLIGDTAMKTDPAILLANGARPQRPILPTVGNSGNRPVARRGRKPTATP